MTNVDGLATQDGPEGGQLDTCFVSGEREETVGQLALELLVGGRRTRIVGISSYVTISFCI